MIDGYGSKALPDDLVIVPTSRWPTTLPDATVAAALAAPIPAVTAGARLEAAARAVSIVVVSRDNLAFTRMCLASVLASTDGIDYELIVVDNGSRDGTVEYLNAVANGHPHVRALFNEDNLGFARANNQGLAVAGGDVLVLLNNDTIVPPGWLRRLVRHLDEEAVGLVGPVTNRAGNEAQVEASYRTYGEFVDFAGRRMRVEDGRGFDIRVATMFCVGIRRDVWSRLGPLDERFEVGLFEDDDYAMRARAAGYRVVCAEDVFVHHFGQASIGRLDPARDYGALFHENQRRWEEKWARAWEPYQHRPSEGYRRAIDRMRSLVAAVVPRQSTVLVVSKGDDALIDFDGCHGLHFPRTEEGIYSGFHPADSAAAIRELEAERQRGAHFLVLPASAFWWLEHYVDFRRHLDHRYPRLVHEVGGGAVFDLRAREPRADRGESGS